MNAKNLIVVGMIAAVVFVLGQLLLLPAAAPATQTMLAAPAQENLPLEANGCTITAEVAEAIKPGEKPFLKLIVKNPTARDVNMELAVREFSTNRSPMSRALIMPSESWTTSCPVAVKAGQSKVIKLVSESEAKQWDNFHYAISAGEQTIRTTQTGTYEPPAVEANAAEESDA
jgi:hypothetical protein